MAFPPNAIGAENDRARPAEARPGPQLDLWDETAAEAAARLAPPPATEIDPWADW